jgi:hypothetical protein
MRAPPRWREIGLPLLAGVLAAAFLGLAAHPFLPSDPDTPVKAAKIEHMIGHGTILRPLEGPGFYRDPWYSLYYMITAAGYRVLGGNVIGYLNHVSAAAGAAFIFCLAFAMRRSLGVHPLLCCAVFLSMPNVVILSTYANEPAFVMAFVAASMALLSACFRGCLPLAAACYVAAFFCRPDAALVFPFVLAWCAMFGGPDGRPSARLARAGRFCLWSAGLGVAYWAAFLRVNIFAILAADVPPVYSAKLRLAYLVYPFCPTVVVLGLVTFAALLVRGRKVALPLLLLVPVFLYFWPKLASPKYLAALAFFYGIPACLALQKSRPALKAACLACVAAWWVAAASPLGVYGPIAGANAILPSWGGTYPTGSYAAFYWNSRRGFYQERFAQDMAAGEEVARRLIATNGQIEIVGGVNPHYVTEPLVRMGREDLRFTPAAESWGRKDWPHGGDRPVVMTQRGILTVRDLPQETITTMRRFLLAGRVKALDSTRGPFPMLVEIGETVPEGTDFSLGRRILFGQEYWEGQGAIPSHWFSLPYRPLSWMPAGAIRSAREPLYADAQFVAVDVPEAGACIFHTRYPFALYGMQDSRDRPRGASTLPAEAAATRGQRGFADSLTRR